MKNFWPTNICPIPSAKQWLCNSHQQRGFILCVCWPNAFLPNGFWQKDVQPILGRDRGEQCCRNNWSKANVLSNIWPTKQWLWHLLNSCRQRCFVPYVSLVQMPFWQMSFGQKTRNPIRERTCLIFSSSSSSAFLVCSFRSSNSFLSSSLFSNFCQFHKNFFFSFRHLHSGKIS